MINIVNEGPDIIKWGNQKFVATGSQELNSAPGRPSNKKKLCYWSGSELLLKTDVMLLNDFKQELKTLLFKIIGENWVASIMTPDEIQVAWIGFKATASGWTTKTQCTIGFNSAIIALGFSEDLQL